MPHRWDAWFCGVVVITSALHAEGREFEPRQNLAFQPGWPDVFSRRTSVSHLALSSGSSQHGLSNKGPSPGRLFWRQTECGVRWLGSGYEIGEKVSSGGNRS